MKRLLIALAALAFVSSIDAARPSKKVQEGEILGGETYHALPAEESKFRNESHRPLSEQITIKKEELKEQNAIFHQSQRNIHRLTEELAHLEIDYQNQKARNRNNKHLLSGVTRKSYAPKSVEA